ncbi:unnamed protein product, partial [Symbiodinium pilosum]
IVRSNAVKSDALFRDPWTTGTLMTCHVSLPSQHWRRTEDALPFAWMSRAASTCAMPPAAL